MSKGVGTMARQPEWETEWVGDSMRLSIDKTGVYSPELTIIQDLGESASELEGQFLVHRFPMDQCTFEDGILSDNPFHADYPAWFADGLEDAARSAGMDVSVIRDALCSDNPKDRVIAYDVIGSYFGFDNFDGYPEYMTEEEVSSL